MKNSISSQLAKPLYLITGILIVCSIVYLPSLTNEFVWDDEEFILTWQVPRSFANVAQFVGGATPPGHEGVYRPIKNIIQAGLWTVWQDQPFGYHLTGLLLHLTNIALVFFLVLTLFNSPWVAALTSLLFGLHPVQTEMVIFATASVDLWGITLLLGSLMLFVLYRRKNILWFAISSFVLAFLALFTYEATFSLPLLIFLVSYFHQKKRNITRSLIAAGIYTIPVIFYMVIRFGILHLPSRSGYLNESFLLTMLTMCKVFLWYCAKLLAPISLHAIPAIMPGITSIAADAAVVTSQSLADVSTIGAVLLFIVLVTTAWITRKHFNALSFGICWLIAALSPFSNIVPTGTLFSERYLYLPSIGFTLCVSWFIWYLLSRKRPTFILYPLVILTFFYISALGLRTATRTLDWKSPVTFWTKAVAQSPDNSYAINNLGLAYGKAGKLKEAMENFTKAAEMNPTDPKARYNIGVTLLTIGKPTLATNELMKAHDLAPTVSVYTIKLIESLIASNQTDRAISLLNQASIDNNSRANLYAYLGNTFLKSKKPEEAEKSFLASYELLPTHEETLNNLGALYNSSGLHARAIEFLSRAAEGNPNDFTIQYNLGTAFLQTGNTTKAKIAFEKAYEINPFSQDVASILEDLRKKEATSSGL